MSFKVGDKVLYPKGWCEGVVTHVYPEDREAVVSFETYNGGGCFPFSFDELKHVPKRSNKDIKSMSNHELGVITKAFVKCGNCSDCPCADILCNGRGWEERKVFVLEVANRLMNTSS